MGLFKKDVCPICGNQVKGIETLKIKDGTLCSNCSKKVDMDLSMIKFQSVSDIKEHFQYMEKNEALYKIFKPSMEYKINGMTFQIDEENKLFYYALQSQKKSPFIHSYDEISNYELLEDGDTITKGGIGSAIIGGALFGGAGAIVGGVTGKKRSKTIMKSLDIKISLKNKYRKQITISFVPSLQEYKSGTLLYNTAHSQAEKITSIIDNMVSSCRSDEQVPLASTSNADEILKYKNLMDSGIITQDEFEQKKKQLLNL